MEDVQRGEAGEDEREEGGVGMEGLAEEERVEGAGGEGLGGRGTATDRPRCSREAGADVQFTSSSSDEESSIGGSSPESDSKSPGPYLSSQ
jgi:hypothetical protein